MNIKFTFVVLLSFFAFIVSAQKINTISPASVSTSGGPLLIGGSGFGTTTGKVYLDGQEIRITSWADNMIGVDIPEGTGTDIPIQVQKASGTMSNILVRFSYDFPIIQFATPITGAAEGGTLVTLSGINFGPTGTSYVTVGGVLATIVSQTHTDISFITPAGRGSSALVVWVGNQSDFVTFYYNNPVNVVLPLEWLSFSAHNTEGGTRLFWATANEYKTAYFDIQRSEDGTNWQSLSQVESKHKGGGNYEWHDKSPLSGIAYYRLRQLDYDGKFAYSTTLSIERKPKNQLTAYPNPTRDFVNLEGFSEDSELVVLNSLGKVVDQKILRGTYEQIDLSTSTPGLYYLRIQKGNDIVHLKIMKIQ